MAFGITLSHNIEAFRQEMARVKRQVPFATALALNDTAFAVRKRIVHRTYPRAFTVRNKRFAGAAMRVKKANKRSLSAMVFDRFERGWLEMQAKGGRKKPFSGSSLSVPVPENVKRLVSGRVPKGKQPKVLRNRPDVFVGRLRKANPAIWQRTRRGLKLMYRQTPSAKIAKRFRFYEDADRTARRAFPYAFRKGLDRALKTARRGGVA